MLLLYQTQSENEELTLKMLLKKFQQIKTPAGPQIDTVAY